MFCFFKNHTIGETGILNGLTDWHSHAACNGGCPKCYRSLEEPFLRTV